ncbi:MAG: M20/M25/M40 family metallo-hydrolase [Bacteroidales bacterium]|nr:M20/M25/M40 family metallo-hydrolase [Bacteroidales bacterium]
MRKFIILIAIGFISFITSNAQVKDPDPVISAALHQVSAANIESYINDLVGFNTRHNLSSQIAPSVGLGAAMKYLQNRCSQWAEQSSGRPAPKVELFYYEAGGGNSRLGANKVNLPDLMVTLPGTEGSAEIVLMAHVDTRVNDNNDFTTFAPGANDDGSGVACLLEVVRILSKIPLKQTIKCIFVSGEEHGLLGATAAAERAHTENWPLIAVINNDMIGNSTASETGLSTDKMVRVFSESKEGEDSDARQLARYVKEMAEIYVPGHEVKLIYRNDRYRRGGDHTPFLQKGYPAVRMSEYYENYDRTHQVVRDENGIKYGDMPSGVNFAYVARNTRVNMAAAMNLAQAPAKPQGAKIANANALSNYTILSWDSVEDAAAYEILYRETDISVWSIYQSLPATVEAQQQVTLPISKDNYFYAVRAVSADGHPGLPAICK